MREPRRYSFHPVERRGVLLGVGAGQLSTSAAGAIFAVAIARAIPGSEGIVMGFCVLAAAAWLAFWPLAGRTVAAWIGPLISFLWRRLHGAVAVGPPYASALSSQADAREKALASREALVPREGCQPSWLAYSDSRLRRSACTPLGLRLEAAEWCGSESLGVIHDLRAGTFAAVVPVKGRAFALVDRDEQERRLAAWGSLLATLARAGSPVERFQWVERTVAGDGQALQAYLAEAGRPAAACGWADAARQSYAEVIAGAGPASVEHQVMVVVAVSRRRLPRSTRALAKGRQGMVEVLGRELRLIQGQMRSADLVAAEPLAPGELARELRSASTPTGAVWPWAMASDEGWSVLHRDDSWHATYWVAEWPRVQVAPDFMAPLLSSAPRRSVSIVMGPVSSYRAAREVEAARTADIADEELRSKAGFVSTARRQRRIEGVLRREAELADGHADYRFSAYVTVSASSRAELEGVASRVEQAASQAQLDLRRLYGQQAEAFSWTLPLARGLA